LRLKNIFFAIVILVLTSNLGLACRYTVREIGFADFGKDQYQLILFKDKRISNSNAKLFKNISYAALLDANINVKVIDVEKERSEPLLKYYNKSKDGNYPNVVLVSPEKGRVKSFLFNNKEDFTQTVWNLLEKIVTSPARTELTEKIIKSYGVVYFIEGNDSEKNNKALEIIESAVDEIRQIMMSLPKPVSIPPAIITVKADERSTEDVLLWSLGWDEETDKNAPAVALIYGRARRMGPMLKGNLIKEDVIRNMLRFIGEDCECGLDRSWMLGTMIPLRWDSKLKAAVLKQYGFDADNPMVISEMSQILSVAPERVNNSVDTDILYGYSESVLIVSDSSKRRNVQQTQVATDESSSEIYNIIIYTFIIILIVVVISGIVFYRYKRRNSSL